MLIGLHDADSTPFPNLALMKLSAYHKARGDTVEPYMPINNELYDRVYSSKVFTFTPDSEYLPECTVRGGTGYGLMDKLPYEVEIQEPDYSLYPNYRVMINGKRREPTAIGFLTRGCIRNCPWCIVPKKEGGIVPYENWQAVKRADCPNMVLLDNNILACDWGIGQLEEMAGRRDIRIDLNQGLDARLITPEIAKILKRIRWIRFIRLACDTSEMLPVIEQATAYLHEAGIAAHRRYCYLLVNDDIYDALWRLDMLSEWGYTVFAQPYRAYDKSEPTEQQRHFANWVNKRSAFKSCSWEDYKYNRAKRGNP